MPANCSPWPSPNSAPTAGRAHDTVHIVIDERTEAVHVFRHARFQPLRALDWEGRMSSQPIHHPVLEPRAAHWSARRGRFRVRGPRALRRINWGSAIVLGMATWVGFGAAFGLLMILHAQLVAR